MQRNCLYCAAPYKARRATKKYCSDNCKQLAYFKRNGMVFGINGSPDTVKPANVKELYDNTDNVKQLTVKTDNVKTVTPVNVKHEVDRSPENSQELKPVISEEQLQELIYRINESLSVKIEQAVINVKKELDVKYALLYGTAGLTQNTKKQIQVCTPVPFMSITGTAKEFIVKDTDQVNVKPEVKDENMILTYYADKTVLESIEDFTINDKDDEPKILQCVEFSEEEPEQEEKQEPESELYDNTDNVKYDSQTPSVKHDTKNTSVQVTVKDEDIKELKVEPAGLATKTAEEIKEQKYEWVQSGFIHEVWNDYQSNEEGFESNYDDPNAEWVNVRLRCIIENVIRLSEYAHVDKQTVDLLNQSLKSLTGSYSFNDLSSDYPYLNTIYELNERINVIAKTVKGEKIPLRISFKLKARLVSIREQFRESIPLIDFSEMNFVEDHRMNSDNGKKNGTWTERRKKYIEAGLIEPDDEEDEEEQKDYLNLKPKEKSDNKRWQYFQKHGEFPPRIAA